MTAKLLLTPLALVCLNCNTAASAVPQQDPLEQPASHHRHILVPDAETVAANVAVTAAPLQPLPGSSIAACVPIRDQHRDILEWLEHHQALGVGRFYVIDHRSVPPLEGVLQDLISSGTVQYFQAEAGFLNKAGAQRPQLAMYQACLDKFRRAHQWMLFIDTDEFLVIRDSAHVTLDTFLREFEDAGGLAVNWQMLGSSGHLQRPTEGVKASYSACLPPNHATNRHVKVIANLAFTTGAGENPHTFTYVSGKTAVNELHEPVEGPKTAVVAASRILLYHYALKSAADFQAKSERGSGMGNHKTTEFFDMINEEATHNCTLLFGRHSRSLAPEQKQQPGRV